MGKTNLRWQLYWGRGFWPVRGSPGHQLLIVDGGRASLQRRQVAIVQNSYTTTETEIQGTAMEDAMEVGVVASGTAIGERGVTCSIRDKSEQTLKST
eukprot:5824109-Amphidinium_carterae.1